MVFMAYLVGTIFILAFAPSLSILAFGEALCGVAWGVFQVSTSQFYFMNLLTDYPFRRYPLPTPAKSSPRSSVHTSPHGFACAGALASSSHQASSAHA